MRPGLLHPAGTSAPPPPMDDALTDDLVADLGLEELWASMARGDGRLREVARAVMLAPPVDPVVVAHRQEALADCLGAASAVRELYALADAAVTAERKMVKGGPTGGAEARLSRACRVLELFHGHLGELHGFAVTRAGEFGSAAFTALFAEVRANLDGDYLRAVTALLVRLRFEHGIVATAGLGKGNKPMGFRLHEPPSRTRPVSRSLRRGQAHVISGAYEDEWRALAMFRGRALETVADAASDCADRVRDYFAALRDEVGFYLGCVNLAEALTGLSLPVCRPVLRPRGSGVLRAEGLYEPVLALGLGGGVTGNDLAADGVPLVMVTGVNRGGKSTFLRSVGLAQLMAGCGMFVAARGFDAAAVAGVFTHFKRAEDRSMSSGKLDEELARMSAIADRLVPGSLLLCNESFVATTEREGSAISAEILQAVTDAGVRVVFVTHLYELADRLRTDRPVRAVFLTADPGRPFRLVPGEPSATARAMALYERVLGG
ncbi:DNA mismatch repair protein MutS [Actinocorallia lasiicapitis]